MVSSQMAWLVRCSLSLGVYWRKPWRRQGPGQRRRTSQPFDHDGHCGCWRHCEEHNFRFGAKVIHTGGREWLESCVGHSPGRLQRGASSSSPRKQSPLSARHALFALPLIGPENAAGGDGGSLQEFAMARLCAKRASALWAVSV
jgi:hypothetical protein